MRTVPRQSPRLPFAAKLMWKTSRPDQIPTHDSARRTNKS